MELEFLDIPAIAEAFTNWRELSAQLIDLKGKSVAMGPQPVKPNIVHSKAEWYKYQSADVDWTVSNNAIDIDLDKIAPRIRELHQAIKEAIPANTWVLIGKDTYIGYQTDSWPGYDPKLEYVECADGQEPTRILKHHVTLD